MPNVSELLDATTAIYRHGEPVEVEEHPGLTVTHLWMGTEHVEDAPVDEEHVPVDVHFFTVVVNKPEAERRRAEFQELCDAWPPSAEYAPENRLASGPSYIELGAQIGTFMGQQDAFRFMALGEVLGYWKVLTPERLHLPPEMRDEAAGNGYVLISGYKVPAETS